MVKGKTDKTESGSQFCLDIIQQSSVINLESQKVKYVP